ncbi:PREDICTED: ankyrin repeat-containing [Prunus dulcis]|uniref:PREDICTED: ankyrin repeat-containing n=1 Tax=Prunus dulcis TaxID=3755 RepID=A0A5E4FM83_PRUDU|nr:PREDICTED: ankyrin repeat-containing [Prunus dulcis]
MGATVSPIANLQLLNRHNYEDWSFQVKLYLLAKDVWDVVEAATEPPTPEDGEAEFRAWRKNNAKALLAIRTCCGDDTYPIIKAITTAKAAWDVLAEELKPSDSEEGHNNNDDESDVKYAPLYDSLKRGDWNAAKEFIDRHEEALTHRGSSSGGTALHEEALHNVEELLKLMTEEDLEIQDDNGCTAFFYAFAKRNGPNSCQNGLKEQEFSYHAFYQRSRK